MQVLVHIPIPMDLGFWALGFQILIEGSAQGDIDQLQAAANTQDRFPHSQALVEQLDLIEVTLSVSGPLGLVRLHAIGFWGNIRATLEQQAVDFFHQHSHINQAAGPGQHQGHCPGGHDPVRHGLFHVLQGLAFEDWARGIRVEKTRAEADFEGTGSHASSAD